MTETPTPALSFGRMAPTLPVTDMAQAHAVYVDGLGFAVTFQNGDPVGFMILKRDAAELHLTLKPDHRPQSHNAAHLLVDDVDALHALCRRLGLRIVKGLKDQDYGLRAFVFADPFGNRIDVAAVL